MVRLPTCEALSSGRTSEIIVYPSSSNKTELDGRRDATGVVVIFVSGVVVIFASGVVVIFASGGCEGDGVGASVEVVPFFNISRIKVAI